MNKTKRIAFGIGIVLVALTFAAMTVPAMAREDDCIFYFNTSDGSHEISVAPGEEATVYLDVFAPVNKTGGYIAAVVYDPKVVKFVDVNENETVSDWMLWEDRAHKLAATDPELRYAKFEAMSPVLGEGPSPPNIRCGDITLRGNGSGVTTIYLGVYPDDVPDSENKTGIGTMIGDKKNWILAEPFTFTCAGPAESFEKELVSGWNLISLPLIPDDNSTSAVLSSMSGNYSTVYRYDATSKQFEDVTTGTVDPGIGYFVNVTAAGTWSYEGTPYNSMSVDLKQGLNLVGWLNCTKQISGNLSSIAGKYNYNARWNANNPKYEVYDANAPPGVPEFNDFSEMERGNGYWIAAKEDCKLEESCSG